MKALTESDFHTIPYELLLLFMNSTSRQEYSEKTCSSPLRPLEISGGLNRDRTRDWQVYGGQVYVTNI